MMRFDIPTLAFVTVFVTTLLGALLVFAGLQNRVVRAPVIWGMAFLLCATGTALAATRGLVPDWLSIQIANVMVLVGLGLIWAGARQFDGRPARMAMVAITPLIWLAACAVPSILADINARTVIASTLAAIVIGAAAYEIWRGRAEPLLSRWPTFITLVLFASVLLARVPVSFMAPQPAGAYHLTASPLYPLLSFGALLFAVVLAFLLLNMAKERAELRHKTAALVDPLTGVANRRAFLADAELLAAQRRNGGAALAVLLFDLDHFKVINDRLGHAGGDAVLINFAATATRVLGPGALFGRIGGEEFGAVLCVGGLGEALAIAEQVRHAFTTAAQVGDVVPTVSIGVALDDEATATLTAIIAAADRALYRAKAKGRNRVASDVAGELPSDVSRDLPGAMMSDAPAAAPTSPGERRGWRRLPASA